MHIALTGSTGFIGSHLCRALASAGHRVRALSRSGRLPEGTHDAEVVRGDLADASALAALVDGTEAVLHLAGAVRGRCAADFHDPNVRGTRALLDAIERHAPGAALLLFSSLAAREPHLSFYAASKRAAEDEVRTRRADGAWLILRPPAVYGAGDTEMLPVFRFMARTGLAPCAGSATQRLSLIHVDDLVAAVLAWLPVARSAGITLCVHDGKQNGYDWHELAATVGASCGRPVRTWEIPRAALDGVAQTNLVLSRLLRRAPMLTPAKLRELRHPDWVCTADTSGILPGWSPAIGLREGLLRTPGWH